MTVVTPLFATAATTCYSRIPEFQMIVLQPQFRVLCLEDLESPTMIPRLSIGTQSFEAGALRFAEALAIIQVSCDAL